MQCSPEVPGTRHCAKAKLSISEGQPAAGRSVSQLLSSQRHDSGAHSSRFLRGLHGREWTHWSSSRRPDVRSIVLLPPLSRPSLPLTLVSWPRFPNSVSSLLSVGPKQSTITVDHSWSMYALTLISPVSAAEPACGPELGVAQGPSGMAGAKLSNRNELEGQSPPRTIRP